MMMNEKNNFVCFGFRREAQKLLSKGISATRIAFGYQLALQHVEQILSRQVVKELTDLTDSAQV
jgi:chaperonin GroEL (HSP60 family)